jgi:hypothetical protein
VYNLILRVQTNIAAFIEINCTLVPLPLLKDGSVMQFQETLKPNYNSVDLTEVELVDMEGGPRENNSLLLDVGVT